MLLVFILNPHAGNGKSQHLIERLQKKGRANGMEQVLLSDRRRATGCILLLRAQNSARLCQEIRVYRDAKTGNSQTLCRDLAQKYGKELLILACGGDGTVNEVARALQGSAASMMVIPFGSGNDFSKSIYKETHRLSQRLLVELGLDEAQCDREEPDHWPDLAHFAIDMVEFSDDRQFKHSFVNVMSIGFDSAVAITASKLVRRIPGLGKFAYIFAVFPALFKKKQFVLDYQFQGKKWDPPTRSESAQLPAVPLTISGTQNYSLAALANARCYGGGFQPNPFMNLQDGVIEIIISKPLNLKKIARLIGAYRKGEAQQHDILYMFSARSGRLLSAQAGQPLVITYDGEILYSKSIDFSVKEKALRLSMPKAAAHENLRAL